MGFSLFWAIYDIDRLRDVSDDVGAQRLKVEALRSEIQLNWSGEAAKIVCSRLNHLVTKMKSVESKIREFADDLKDRADEIEEEENKGDD